MKTFFKFELTKEQEQHALEIHKKAIVTDFQQNAFLRASERAEKYYPEFVEGGISFTNTNIMTDLSPYPEVSPSSFKRTVLELDKLRNIVKNNPEKFVFVEFAEDVRRAKKERSR